MSSLGFRMQFFHNMQTKLIDVRNTLKTRKYYQEGVVAMLNIQSFVLFVHHQKNENHLIKINQNLIFGKVFSGKLVLHVVLTKEIHFRIPSIAMISESSSIDNRETILIFFPNFKNSNNFVRSCCILNN